MADQTGWVAKDSQDDAVATATQAAESGKKHTVYSVDASFSGAVTKLLQIKDGSDIAWEGYVVNSREVVFPKGLSITKGNAVSAVLAASGTGGTIGKVNIHGTTRG